MIQCLNRLPETWPLNERYLIGVSGGRDSVALLHALVALGYKRLVVCHVNHQLRGRASGQDAVFVRRLAASLGMPVEVVNLPVRELASQWKISLETAARRVRLNAFARTARRKRCKGVFLAHHAEDQAETVLFNLGRGSGLAGIRGMAPEKVHQTDAGEIVLLRPLLNVRRRQIEDYLASVNATFREDATNASDEHARNRVRAKVLPALAAALERDPVPALLRHAETARSENDLLSELSKELLRQVQRADADRPWPRLQIRPHLISAHPALQQRVIQLWLDECRAQRIDHHHIAAAVRLLHSPQPARSNLPDSAWVRRKAGFLHFDSRKPVLETPASSESSARSSS